VDVAAAPTDVWRVLTDFGAYAAWNPMILMMAGPVRRGARLRAQVQAPGRRAITFSPRVITARPGCELRLRAGVGSRRILLADHRFEIEPLAPGCSRFIQTEHFSGLLVPLMRRMIEGDTLRGLEMMNAALKARAEYTRSFGVITR
jgi:hypothetical protein